MRGVDWGGRRTVPIRVRSACAKLNDDVTSAAGIVLLYAARSRERIDKYLVLQEADE